MRTLYQATVAIAIGVLFSLAVPLITYSQNSRNRRPSVERGASNPAPKTDFSDAAPWGLARSSGRSPVSLVESYGRA